MKVVRVLASLMVAACMLAPASADVVVYEQLPDSLDLPGGYYSDAQSGYWYSQRMADDFTLSSATDVTGVNFWGFSEFFIFPDLTNMTGFSVQVYADAGGAPGASVGSQNFTTAQTNPTVVGGGGGGSDHYFHTTTFTSPLSLAAGTYWLSVGAFLSAPFDDAYAWTFAAAGGGNNVIAADFFDGNGYQVFNGLGDVAFQIRAVPEPSSALLFAFAAAGMTFRRRR